MGLKILQLEGSQELLDLSALHSFHAYMHTFIKNITARKVWLSEKKGPSILVKFQPAFQGIQLQQVPAQPSPALPATDLAPTQ